MEWPDEAVGLVFSGVVTTATVVYAILTWRLVRETNRLRKVETEPDIAVYLEPQDRWINFMDLIIRNIGKGPAYDIKFDFEPGMPRHERLAIGNITFFQRGINYMAPGSEYRFFFGSVLELLPPAPAERLEPVNLCVSYRGKSGEVGEGGFRLDISDFEGVRRVGTPPVIEMANALKKLSDDVHSLVGSDKHFQRRLRVDAELPRCYARLIGATEESISRRVYQWAVKHLHRATERSE